LDVKPIRQIYKFPQMATMDIDTNGVVTKTNTFRRDDGDSNAPLANNQWRAQHYNFCGGCIYSIAKFHGIVYNNQRDNNICDCVVDSGFARYDAINNSIVDQQEYVAGAIVTSNFRFSGNTYYGLCGNSNTGKVDGDTTLCTFGANWLNMSIYLPQTGWGYDNTAYQCGQVSNSQFTFLRKNDTYYMQNNQQQIAGPYNNTCSFARSDINWTDFIKVPKTDIIYMSKISDKGIMTNDDGKTFKISESCNPSLEGTYRNGFNVPPSQTPLLCWNNPTPPGGGRLNGVCTCSCIDYKTYIYKGFDSSNVIDYVISLGLV